MKMKSAIVIAVTIFTLMMINRATYAASIGPTPEQQQRHMELVRKGATLWPIYCNHCHNAREPAEFAPYQWDQIIMHMRTLENLPPQNADAILEFLKTSR
ncbi:MAG TPA: hypothetical protein VN867_14595 [Candidatus Binataceae bacterium]|nr:hypothetical protein [Candidatus Binataceae bacterium]